ncbi:MAG: hypothetical protein ACNY01_06690 [Desulfobacteria bacterium]
MKKQRKNYSFDAVVKSFMQYYQLPTKHDIEKLDEKLDRLEQAIYSLERVTPPAAKAKPSTPAKKEKTGSGSPMSAVDTVFGIIKRHHKGIDVPTIRKKTGFGDKTVRNAIFRLTKQEKIARKSRGIYTTSTSPASS